MCYTKFMKKSFKFVYSTKVKISLYVLLILFLFSAIMNILRLSELFGLVPYNYLLDISGLIFSILTCIFVALTLFHSRYVIDDEHIIEYIGIMKMTIPCRAISKVISKNDKDIFILYTSNNVQPACRKLNIKSDSIDNFFNKIKSINSLIIFEYIGEKN